MNFVIGLIMFFCDLQARYGLVSEEDWRCVFDEANGWYGVYQGSACSHRVKYVRFCRGNYFAI